MEEFNTIEKVNALFASVNGLGNENHFFVACQDKEKVTGGAAVICLFSREIEFKTDII